MAPQRWSPSLGVSFSTHPSVADGSPGVRTVGLRVYNSITMVQLNLPRQNGAAAACEGLCSSYCRAHWLFYQTTAASAVSDTGRRVLWPPTDNAAYHESHRCCRYCDGVDAGHAHGRSRRRAAVFLSTRELAQIGYGAVKSLLSSIISIGFI